MLAATEPPMPSTRRPHVKKRINFFMVNLHLSFVYDLFFVWLSIIRMGMVNPFIKLQFINNFPIIKIQCDVKCFNSYIYIFTKILHKLCFFKHFNNAAILEDGFLVRKSDIMISFYTNFCNFFRYFLGSVDITVLHMIQ